VLSEAVYGLFVLVTVVSSRIVIGVLLPDHVSLLIIKQLQTGIKISEPLMSIYLLNRQPFLRINFKQPSQQIPRLN
jgi:hypothetical protein